MASFLMGQLSWFGVFGPGAGSMGAQPFIVEKAICVI